MLCDRVIEPIRSLAFDLGVDEILNRCLADFPYILLFKSIRLLHSVINSTLRFQLLKWCFPSVYGCNAVLGRIHCHVVQQQWVRLSMRSSLSTLEMTSKRYEQEIEVCSDNFKVKMSILPMCIDYGYAALTR